MTTAPTPSPELTDAELARIVEAATGEVCDDDARGMIPLDQMHDYFGAKLRQHLATAGYRLARVAPAEGMVTISVEDAKRIVQWAPHTQNVHWFPPKDDPIVDRLRAALGADR